MTIGRLKWFGQVRFDSFGLSFSVPSVLDACFALEILPYGW